jgi:hypothetical protein
MVSPRERRPVGKRKRERRRGVPIRICNLKPSGLDMVSPETVFGGRRGRRRGDANPNL